MPPATYARDRKYAIERLQWLKARTWCPTDMTHLDPTESDYAKAIKTEECLIATLDRAIEIMMRNGLAA
jgi:hypothetical protein